MCEYPGVRPVFGFFCSLPREPFMRRLTQLICLSLLPWSASIAPGQSPAATPPVQQPAKVRATIGIVAANGEEGSHVASQFMRDAAARSIELVQADATVRSKGQIEACRDLIARKVKMVIVFPESESGWDTLLAEAHSSSVPVIAINRPIHCSNEKHTPVLIVPDFEQQGLLAGKWIVKALNGAGGVLEIRGVEGSTPSIERQAGFMAQLGRYRKLEPLGSIGQSSDDAVLRSRLEELLTNKGEKVRAIFSHSARGARVAAATIEASNLPGKERISIIAVDSGEGLTGVFKSDAPGASVECEPNASRVVFDAIDRALLGDPLPPVIPLRSVVIERHLAPPPATPPQPRSDK